MQACAHKVLLRLVAIMTLAAFASAPANAEDAVGPLELRNGHWTVLVRPDTLHVEAQLAGGQRVELAAGQDGLGPVDILQRDGQECRWRFADRQVDVAFRLEGQTLAVQFHARAPGRFTWPICGRDGAASAYILPLFEGSYVPADDPAWQAFLVGASPMNTTEGLCMPFWGVDCGEFTLTYLLTNPFDNEVVFSGDNVRTVLTLCHEYKANWRRMEYGVLVALGGPSPIAPALHYRQWLADQGQLVSLKEKIAHVPNAEKLLGAVHAYLWGDGLVSRHDVRNWSGLCAQLVEQGKQEAPSPGRRVWDLMAAEARGAAADIASARQAPAFATRLVAAELSAALERTDFYDAAAWSQAALPEEARQLVASDPQRLSLSSLWRLNCLLLESAFPGMFVSSERWGDGVSVKMMERLAGAGVDRAWLGLDSWKGALRHPQAVRRAVAAGYLVAPYDSYDSIHSPDEEDTWETAQFGPELYEAGAVVRADGTRVPGFKGKGYALSPLAARPYVEKRVNSIMQAVPERFNSWFVDCDAYGQLYDDYSPLHCATQKDDMEARLGRMAWVRDAYGLVVGSERGAAYAAPVIHFAHGMMTPVVGWGDPDLQTDKESQHYLGAWWPPDGPAVFVKQVPLKEQYRVPYYNPRFRLPLYQAVFHDCLVATHHWLHGSLKFSDQVDTVELLELLYNVPPLYHLNLDEFARHRERIAAHYRFFSHLHRELGLLPLTRFEWLTEDRLVQRTQFGERMELIVNFGPHEFRLAHVAVPGRAIVARRLDGTEAQLYRPAGQ